MAANLIPFLLFAGMDEVSDEKLSGYIWMELAILPTPKRNLGIELSFLVRILPSWEFQSKLLAFILFRFTSQLHKKLKEGG